MNSRIQAGIAVTLAVGLHVGVFLIPTEPAGAVSAGSGGTELVSIEAADEVLADMVEEWEQTPDPIEETAEMDTPPEPVEVPPPELAEIPPPEVPPMPELAQLAPPADVTPPPPPPPEPPKPEPEPEPPKPEPRPEPKPKPKAQKEKPKQQVAKPERRENRPPSPGRQAQVAAGTGGGANAGDGGAAAAATRTKGAAELRNGWGAQIRARIERKLRRESRTGRVTLNLTVASNGALVSASLAGSSGDPRIDNMVLNAARSATYPAAPKGLGEARASFTVAINIKR